MHDGQSAHQRSLLRRLKLFGVIAAAVMIGLLGLTGWQDYHARIVSAQSQCLVAVRTLASHEARRFQAADVALAQLADRLTEIMRIGDPPAVVVRGLLAATADSQPILRSIAFDTTDGRRVAHSAGPVGTVLDWPRLDEAFLRNLVVQDPARLVFLSPPAGERRGMAGARTVAAPDDGVAGVLVVDLVAEVFVQFYGLAGQELPLEVALLSADGRIMAASADFPGRNPAGPGRELSGTIALPPPGAPAGTFPVTVAGEDVVAAVMAVPGWPFIVMAVTSRGPLLWDWYLIVGLLAVAGLFIVGVVTVAVRVMSGNIGRLLETEEALRQRVVDLEISKLRLQRQGEEVAALADQLYLAREEAVAARCAADTANQAKSEFLARMSHELRTPLNAILGFSEIMKESEGFAETAETFTQYACDIHDSGVHLLAVINDILDLAKVEAGRMELAEEPVDLAYAARSMTRLVRETARRRGLAVETRIPPQVPRIRSDQRVVKQMLLNLLSNSLKFTPSGGTITIAIARRDGGVEVTVRDTGIGIAEEHFAKVLEPFGQVTQHGEERVEGTGLGLPLVKSFIEAQAGRFTLESEVGRGTTVTLWFPPDRVLNGGDSSALRATG